MTQLDTIQRTVQQLRDLLNKGEIFTALPNMLGKVIESVAVEPATPIKIPRETTRRPLSKSELSRSGSSKQVIPA